MCDVTEFTCQNEACIPLSQQNNTINDCGDNSDEVLIPCRKPAFSCRTSGCITKEWVLDGNPDCGDLSDEAKVIKADCSMVKDCCDCDVYVSNSVCQSGVCQCQSGFYANTLGTVCIKRTVGDNCIVHADCLDSLSNSSCSVGQCVCDIGFQASPNKAKRDQKVIGDACSSGEDCLAVIGNSGCKNSKCVCNQGYHSSTDHRICVRRYSSSSDIPCVLRKLHASCETDSDCTDNIGKICCQHGKCQCVSGFSTVSENETCHLRSIGSICDSDSDCHSAVPFSRCSLGFCICDPGYQNIDDITCGKRKIGDQTCRLNMDCSSAIVHSKCRSGLCICNYGYYPAHDKQTCIRRYLGDHSICQYNLDCGYTIPNSVCRNKACTCKTGKFMSRDGKQCVNRRIGDPCSMNRDCYTGITHSGCDAGGTCVCNLGHETVGGNTSCVLRELDSTCSTQTDCSNAVFYSTCLDRLCACSKGYIRDGNSCLIRTLFDQCDSEEDCSMAVQHSVCREGSCQCEATYENAGTKLKCYKKLIGSSCSRDSECDHVTHGTCTNGQCVCMLGHNAETSWECKQRRIWDATCLLNVDCDAAIINSLCTEGKCECLTGYYVTTGNTSCIKRRVGDTCVDVEDCSAAVWSSTCGAEYTCQCRPGYRSTDSGATCVKRRLSDPCSVHVDCAASVSNASCIQGACGCAEEFIAAAHGTRCDIRPTLPPYWEVEALVPNTCTGVKGGERPGVDSSVRCADPHATCVGRECVCRGGYARRSATHRCQRSKGFMLTLDLTSIAGRYELFALGYTPEYWSNSSTYTNFTSRLKGSGIAIMLDEGPFSDYYLESRVLKLTGSDLSLKATIIIYMPLHCSLSRNNLKDTLVQYIQRSYGEVGTSRIYTFYDPVQLTLQDLDECEVTSINRLNDCSVNATCMNTEGYFTCMCKLDYKDYSEHPFIGRHCTYQDPRSRILAIMRAGSRMRCTEDVCETPWGLVAGVLSVIFLLLLGLLVLEICWKKKKRIVHKRMRVPMGVMVDNPEGPSNPGSPQPERGRRVRLKEKPTIHKMKIPTGEPSTPGTSAGSESASDDSDSVDQMVEDTSSRQGMDNYGLSRSNSPPTWLKP